MSDAAFEIDQVEGVLVGRDPRKISLNDWAKIGVERQPVLQAIRAKCLDCSANQIGEIRRCVAHRCALWPFRMGVDPFRQRRELTEAQKAALSARLEKGRDGGVHEQRA
jgi:hypothetical protein